MLSSNVEAFKIFICRVAEMMRQRGHNLSEERVAEIRRLSQDPNIYQKVGHHQHLLPTFLDTALFGRPQLTPFSVYGPCSWRVLWPRRSGSWTM